MFAVCVFSFPFRGDSEMETTPQCKNVYNSTPAFPIFLSILEPTYHRTEYISLSYQMRCALIQRHIHVPHSY